VPPRSCKRATILLGKMNSLFSRPLRDYVFGIRARGCAALLAPVGENTHAAEVRQSVECTLGVIQQTRARRFKNFVQAECRGRSRLTHPRIRDNGPFIWRATGSAKSRPHGLSHGTTVRSIRGSESVCWKACWRPQEYAIIMNGGSVALLVPVSNVGVTGESTI